MNDLSQYDINDVPTCFRQVLQRIEMVLGDPVLIDDFDDEWLYFRVLNWPNRTVAASLQAKSGIVFPGSERCRYQVVCPWDPAEAKGLMLHYMSEMEVRQEYRWGCWYY